MQNDILWAENIKIINQCSYIITMLQNTLKLLGNGTNEDSASCLQVTGWLGGGRGVQV